MKRFILIACTIVLFASAFVFLGQAQTEASFSDKTEKEFTYNVWVGAEYNKRGTNIAIFPDVQLYDNTSLGSGVAIQSLFHPNSTGDVYIITPVALGNDVSIRPFHDSSGSVSYTGYYDWHFDETVYSFQITNLWTEPKTITENIVQYGNVIIGLVLLAFGCVSVLFLYKSKSTFANDSMEK